MEHKFQFCKSSDGANLAFSTFGTGPPMIWPPYWVTHIEEEWKAPFIRNFFSQLATKNTIIRYDKHGCGLSDRDRTEFTLEKELRDLESIINHLDLKRFSLVGMSQGGPTAIAYVSKYPQHVSHLILFGTWPYGDAGAPSEIKAALCNLIRSSWGLGSKTLSDIFVPDCEKEVYDLFVKWQRRAATGEMAARLLESEENINVSHLLPNIDIPTLVLHRKGDRACSVDGGRELARLIPNSSLVLLEGIDHLPWAGDTESVLHAFGEFLDNGGYQESVSPKINMPPKKHKRKLAAILSADVKGYTILMTDDEFHTIEALKKFRQIMADFIQQHFGRVVDNPGDNLLAEFSSAVDAVECAVQIQNRLKKENTKFDEDRRLQFRIGVNIGDVVHDGDRIYGSGVNVAARIEGIADPGGVCISRGMYDQVKDKLDLGFEYIGEHQVKNIEEPVRVYKVLIGTDAPKPLVEEQLELPDKPSIAALPFTNMSGDSGQEYFSDGLTEQIINGLCKVSNMFVIARNSSFAYKGKAVSVKHIAKELGVRYILEGSVQRAGNRVRITAQLIDATTDYHMWSENYDRDLEDIFALQDEITLKIIETMQIKLTMGEQARLWAGTTSNIQAFDKCMKGVEYFSHGNEKGNRQARQFLKEALEFDKAYSLAYAILGITHILDIFFGWSTSILESFEEAEMNAQKAFSLNDKLDLPHILLSWINLFKRRHGEAIKEGELAIKLNPNGAEAHAGLGLVFCYSDRADLAIKLIKQTLRLDPIPLPHIYHFMMIAYRTNGQYEKAIEWAEKSLSFSPDQLSPNLTLVASYSLLHRVDEAKRTAEEVIRISPNISLDYLAKTLPFKHQETCDTFINALRKAGLPD